MPGIRGEESNWRLHLVVCGLLVKNFLPMSFCIGLFKWNETIYIYSYIHGTNSTLHHLSPAAVIRSGSVFSPLN
jgi:hypothetical protein